MTSKEELTAIDTNGSNIISDSSMTGVSVDDSQGYFSSYTDPHVHEVMLRDWPRMAAYRRFFEENCHLVEGKTVMDVGAGTGILSLFAASVGARKVYAIEASNTANLCKEIVQQNGFGDKIEVIHSTVEEAELADGVKVDIIVSEWMGFYLLHESMLDSVIIARDRFLAEDGIMVPAVARLYLAPVNMDSFLEEKFEFWTNVCGFDFSAAIPHVHRKLLQEPLTTELSPQQVVTAPKIIREFDLKTVTVSDVQAFSEKVYFETEKSLTVHGFALWFDVDFRQGKVTSETSLSTDQSAESSVSSTNSKTYLGGGNWTVVPPSVLSTSPISPVTHWKQTVILLPRGLSINVGDILGCYVHFSQDAINKRHYNIVLELVDDNENEDESDDGVEDDGDTTDHPVPCDCSNAKCRLIKALMEKYNEEQDALEAEAETVNLTAEVEAAEAVGAEMGEDDSVNISGGQ